MPRVVEERHEAKGEVRSALDELALEGARRMLAEALEIEVEAYLDPHRKERDGDDLALVVRNGHARERRVTVGSGTLTVRAPRVNDRVVDGERQKFTSERGPGRAARRERGGPVARVDVRHCEASPAGHEGRWLVRRRARDGPPLLLLAERTWRRLDGHELLPLVRAGVKFKDGAQVARNDGAANKGKRGKIAA